MADFVVESSSFFGTDPSIVFDEEEMNYLAMRDSYEELVRVRSSATMKEGSPGSAGVDVLSIPSDVFYEAIFAEYFRVRSYRVGAVFVCFVLVLCLILFMNRIDVYAQTSSYFSQQGALSLMEVEQFQAMESVSDFYAWADVLVDNLDKAREPIKHSLSVATPYPMGMILVRQIRGLTVTCSPENTIFTGLRPRVCVPSASIDTEPFGSPSNPQMYKPNGQLPASAVVGAQSVAGIYMGMSDVDATYERHLYFSALGAWTPQTAAPVVTTAAPVATASPANVSANTTTTTTTTVITTTTTTQGNTTTSTQLLTTNASEFRPTDSPSIVGKAAMKLELERMKNWDFFNESTWSFAVDVAFVHPALRVFTVVTLLMERLPSNDMRPTVEANTFLITKISLVDATSFFTFIADLFVAGFCIFCIAEVFLDVRSRLELSVSQIDAIMQSIVPLVITVLQIFTLTSVVADRFEIWALCSRATSTIDKSTNTESAARVTINALSQISSMLQSSYRNFSISLLLCLFRLLVFSESLDGLNMLSRAIRLNGSELATVLMICAVVIVMFGVAGNVFFDDELKEYSTVRSTVSSLTRALSSSGTDQWRELSETSPRQALFFFVMFWLVLWAFSLNMVLAIVVSAVDAVQRTAQEGVKFDSLWHVLKRHVLLLGSFYSGGRISPDTLRRGGAAVAAAAAGTKTLLPYGRMRYQRWQQDYATRYSAVVNARSWVVKNEKEVFFNELNLVLNSVPADIRRQLYSAASQVYATQLALRATRSRTADEAEVASRQIDKQLLALERKLDLAPKTAKYEQELEEDEADEDPDVAFDRLLKKAVRTRAGVAEMLILTHATGVILQNDQDKL